MSKQKYLIDTNILIELEDNHPVAATYTDFYRLATKHHVDLFVHKVAQMDFARDDKDERRTISLSKLKKYQVLEKTHGLTKEKLEKDFGPLNKPNDVVDATLLYTLKIGAVDYLVTQDKGLHARARKHLKELSSHVLSISDAVNILTKTYEPKKVTIRQVKEVKAYEISIENKFFDSLKNDYPKFNEWWRDKCVKQHRLCWVIYEDDDLVALIVRKDETNEDTYAVTEAEKILKICTFKVAEKKYGVKLGELLLKQILWYAQDNNYDLAYLTVYEHHDKLIELLKFYGFNNTDSKSDGELIYERIFSPKKLLEEPGKNAFESARMNYPRFIFNDKTEGFGVPIQENYHDTLFPDLRDQTQLSLFGNVPATKVLKRAGNTIHKVYLCRAPSKLGETGSLLFFYKGDSTKPPSQAMTALGILQNWKFATSLEELMQLADERSVYSEEALAQWEATKDNPVKVISFLLIDYIEPPVGLDTLLEMGVMTRRPAQSIFNIKKNLLRGLLEKIDLKFEI